MKIKITKNGPYKVDGKIPLEREEIQVDDGGAECCWKNKGKVKTEGLPANAGRKDSQAGDYNLCRCGKSKNKPFCDGTHFKENFKCEDADESEKYDENAEEYPGPKQTLCDCEKLCSSARFCHRAGSAWNLVEKSDSKSQEILKEEVCNCPSGRLVLKNNKTGKVIEKKLDQSISITEDKPAGVSGPLWVKGEIEIESPNGKSYEKRNRVTLCRCGKSKNKPFCDGSHIDVGFKE